MTVTPRQKSPRTSYNRMLVPRDLGVQTPCLLIMPTNTHLTKDLKTKVKLLKPWHKHDPNEPLLPETKSYSWVKVNGTFSLDGFRHPLSFHTLSWCNRLDIMSKAQISRAKSGPSRLAAAALAFGFLRLAPLKLRMLKRWHAGCVSYTDLNTPCQIWLGYRKLASG